MNMRCRRAGLGTVCLTVVATLALAGSAHAAGTGFTCRASAARVTALTLIGAEPVVANAAGDPCRSDATGAMSLSLPGILAGGTGLASTTSAASSAAGAGQVQNLALGLPVALGPLGALDLTATTASSTASVRCSGSTPSLSGSSQVVGLTLAGRPITASGSYDLSSLLPGLSGVADVALDQRTTSAGELTQDAVDVTILGGPLDGAHIVLGEAHVGADGNCASNGGGGGTGGGGGGGGTGTGGGSGGGCPAGTTATGGGACAIPAGTEGNAHAITVPAGDVSGALVISLAQARRRFGKRTACLNGAGPQFVVIGTRRADRITVRRVRMRVMGLAGNDRITVRGGRRTCVNGGAGNDVVVNRQRNFVTVFGANGNDRITLGNGPGFVLGGKGNDRIVAGNGKVDLQGNAGNDYLRAGNGPVRLGGGSGNDTLIAGQGRAHLNGGPGRNRLVAHGRIAYVKAAKGSRSVAYVRRSSAGYARHHGVRRVHVIRR
jgi:hypothetical protein